MRLIWIYDNQEDQCENEKIELNPTFGQIISPIIPTPLFASHILASSSFNLNVSWFLWHQLDQVGKAAGDTDHGWAIWFTNRMFMGLGRITCRGSPWDPAWGQT